MVVHDRSYSRWDGVRSQRPQAIWVIFERGVLTGLNVLFKRKLFAQLLSMAAYGPFLFAVGVLYVAFFVTTQPELAEWGQGIQDSGLLERVTPNGETAFFYLYRLQMTFVLVLCVLIGSGLIAEDRRTNALELYLSRPVWLLQYLLGKLSVVGFFIAMVSLVPAVLLVAVHMVLTGLDPELVPGQLELMGRVVVACVVPGLLLGLLVLAASSLTSRGRSASIVFVGFLVLLEGVVVNMVAETFRAAGTQLLSVGFNVGQVMAWVLDSPADLDPEVPVLHSAVVLAGWALLSLVIILRRVRPVEIVA